MPNVQCRWCAMNVHYRLWHNRDSHYVRGYARPDGILRGYEGTIEVPQHPADPTRAICEAIFARHNSDDRPDGATAPSLSVGDVVEVHVGGMRWDAFTVLPTGWQQVDLYNSRRLAPGDV
jgi:hypothetical protein